MRAALLRHFALAGLAGGLAAACAAREARAGLPGLGSLGLSANSLISNTVVKDLVTFIAFGTQHRPYEPATPLGLSIGLDVSVEATLFTIPSSFFTDLSSVGAPASSPLPALPMAKLHLHKGFGDYFDVGGSMIYYDGDWVVGTDVKIIFLQGEEGPTYAFRFCYTWASATLDGITVSTHTFVPQVLLSRRIDFADPYLGAAFEYADGSASGDITVPPGTGSGTIPAGVTIPPIPFTPVGASNTGFYIFGGVSMRIPVIGIRLTVEGAYDTAGVDYFGTKVGFTF